MRVGGYHITRTAWKGVQRWQSSFTESLWQTNSRLSSFLPPTCPLSFLPLALILVSISHQHLCLGLSESNSHPNPKPFLHPASISFHMMVPQLFSISHDQLSTPTSTSSLFSSYLFTCRCFNLLVFGLTHPTSATPSFFSSHLTSAFSSIPPTDLQSHWFASPSCFEVSVLPWKNIVRLHKKYKTLPILHNFSGYIPLSSSLYKIVS